MAKLDENTKKIIEKNRKETFELFNYRCAICYYPAVTIHEIVPRSRRPKDWWDIDNMISVCAKCHEKIHSHGATVSMVELAALRKERLK